MFLASDNVRVYARQRGRPDYASQKYGQFEDYFRYESTSTVFYTAAGFYRDGRSDVARLRLVPLERFIAAPVIEDMSGIFSLSL